MSAEHEGLFGDGMLDVNWEEPLTAERAENKAERNRKGECYTYTEV